MTDKKTEALKALEEIHPGNMTPIAEEAWNKAITAIREALAEQPAPQQEPVAWIDICEKGQMSGLRYWSEPDNRHEVPLYKSPPNVPTARASKPAQQQEPVACKTLCELCVKRGYHFCANAAQTTPIPSPPASKPLTDDRIKAIYSEQTGFDLDSSPESLMDFARAIEAAHGIKGDA